MSTLVYRILEMLSAIVLPLPIGTNLGLLHLLWTLLSGRLLAHRGALIPALHAAGLAPAAVRRAWQALGHGAWALPTLLTAFRAQVTQAGHWHPTYHEGYRAVAVDTLGFFRPRLRACGTHHYSAAVGKALPAIPFGLAVEVGHVQTQTVPLLTTVCRAPHAQATERELQQALLAQVAATLAPTAVCVTDRGFPVAYLLAAGLPRFVARVPRNFTARRYTPPPGRGRGRRPTRGTCVRLLPRTYKHHLIAATPPDRTETFQHAGHTVRAEIWTDLCHPAPAYRTQRLWALVLHHPRFKNPWALVTNLPTTLPSATLWALARGDAPPTASQTLATLFRDRWPVEHIPLTAKQLLGAHRQFVFAPEARQRLPELALLASNVLMYLAATLPAQPTGFWDRAPRPTAGRLRRVLHELVFSEAWPLPATIRPKAARTDHLPKGIQAHRRRAQAQLPPT